MLTESNSMTKVVIKCIINGDESSAVTHVGRKKLQCTVILFCVKDPMINNESRKSCTQHLS